MIYVDFATQERIVKPSGRWYAEVTRDHAVPAEYRIAVLPSTEDDPSPVTRSPFLDLTSVLGGVLDPVLDRFHLVDIVLAASSLWLM